jgi:NAD(P)-dependent dehydrogenase (short-subunit alcohol dehydrogenase family)
LSRAPVDDGPASREDANMGLLEAHAGLSGRRAVVVGGAFGVGRAVTLALAKARVAIATCDADAAAADAIAGEVQALGAACFSTPADVCDSAALGRFYDEVERRFESVDILVNVAGGVKRSLFMDTAEERNEIEIRLNYGYILQSVRRCVPLMRKTGRGGSIINFTTIEAHRGAAGFAVYAGAKAATTNFSRALAVELGAERIRVNMIAPDTTPSRTSNISMEPDLVARFERLRPETFAEGYRMYIPQEAPPTEEDLADAVLFLASDQSRAITGITLHVDGGTMASAGFIRWPYGDGFSPAALPETLKRVFE